MGFIRRRSRLLCEGTLYKALIHSVIIEVLQNSRISLQSFVWRNSRVKSVLINVIACGEKHGNGSWLMVVHVACFAAWNVYYVMIRDCGASRFLSYQQAY